VGNRPKSTVVLIRTIFSDAPVRYRFRYLYRFSELFGVFMEIDLGVDKASENVRLVMGSSDTGSDKKKNGCLRFLRLLFNIDMVIERHTF